MTLVNLLEHACCAAALMASSSVTSKIRGVNEELNSLFSLSRSCCFLTLPYT